MNKCDFCQDERETDLHYFIVWKAGTKYGKLLCIYCIELITERVIEEGLKNMTEQK